jgi:penicillin-binding protein 1A
MTFANHGSSDTPLVIKSILNPDGSDFFRNEYRPKPKLDAGIADMMTYLLQGVFEDGTARSARALGFDRPAAGKTGTTNDYRDAWFVGYTPQLTGLVWVGLDQGILETAKIKKKVHLTGAVAALPIWIDLMKRSLQYEPELPFPESDHLIEMRLDIRSGQKAESSCPESQVVLEKVIAGREPEKSTCLSDFPKDID